MGIIISKYDCGLMVIKYMELWNGVERFNRKIMSQYSTVCNVVLLWHLCGWFIYVLYKLMGFFYFQQEIQGFREKLVRRWVTHEDTIHWMSVLSNINT